MLDTNPTTSPPRLVRIAGKGTWFIYHQRRRVSTGTQSRPEAERFLRDFVAGLSRPAATETSVGALLGAYLVNRTKRRIHGLERLKYAHKRLLAFFGSMRIDDITGDACIDYAEHRFAPPRPVSPRTVRTELEALRAALHWGQTRDGGRVVKEMPDLELPAKGGGRDRWLTREEADRLLAACNARHVRLFVALALYTAARKGAILSLKWDRVDLENRLVDYRTPAEIATRKRKVAVRMNDTLYSILKAAKDQAASDFVIEWAGTRVASIRHGFANACERAGLIDVTPHTLRHTAVTWMIRAKVSTWDAAQHAGMTEDMVRRVYGHHDPDFGREAAAALDCAA